MRASGLPVALELGVQAAPELTQVYGFGSRGHCIDSPKREWQLFHAKHRNARELPSQTGSIQASRLKSSPRTISEPLAMNG